MSSKIKSWGLLTATVALYVLTVSAFAASTRQSNQVNELASENQENFIEVTLSKN
jgi:hypothetical protein